MSPPLFLLIDKSDKTQIQLENESTSRKTFLRFHVFP